MNELTIYGKFTLPYLVKLPLFFTVKRGQSGNGTIVKMMPWGVRNRSYQTSWSKGGDTVGGQSLTPPPVYPGVHEARTVWYWCHR